MRLEDQVDEEYLQKRECIRQLSTLERTVFDQMKGQSV